ncbi:hypothetical protein [Actibacterium lipolyticum]|uniref:50S ribosomal protein L35 n=1 Tax=Actibacterium lipolyticum TaxID=1524263 RepID=A0A238KR12_9RHOB|nr:hypothetical protein [Actibacterium lipolyticum]SMX45299.1 hypothetical protein COL8621_02759 [Actibacterium lipolyticum]
MDTDLFLVIGVVLGVLAIPSLLGAYSEGRPPRAASIMVLIAGTLILLAVTNHPSGYAINDVPEAFVRVFGRYVN